ncbi:CTTNBP2 N-terminal-like protein isoform X1 [Artemia franciscana]|uniref:Cortactin-binding protein-2 N-terminal domain-containing protein n=1 Tax=Artemia franciscana TaxID=6661 RepID=A0AA88IHJ5_ARTSF|nr:hypothetical protein QYM36_000881 [Artemia franciscana]
MDEPGSSTENTVKLRPNSRIELTKSELLTLLGNMEAELQARDVVVALLKCERVKQLLVQAKYGQLNWNSPLTALQRDSFAIVGGTVDSAVEGQGIIDETQGALDRLVGQQKNSLKRMVNLLQTVETRHCQELEAERESRLRVEQELKLIRDALEKEKERKKEIILLLLAERKKIIGKLVEERKKTEDLVQILSEEKARMELMAESLEEETRKTLGLESEVEKQQQQLDTERQHFKLQLTKGEKRCKELEATVERLQSELDSFKQNLPATGNYLHQSMQPFPRTSPPLNSKQPPITPPRTVQSNQLSTSRSGSNLARGGSPCVDDLPVPPPAVLVGSTRQNQVVATVNSTPVVLPTTGIAKSVSPNSMGMGLSMGMGMGTIRPLPLNASDAQRKQSSNYHSAAESTQALLAGIEQTLAQVSPDRATARPFPSTNSQSQLAPVTSRVAVQASPGSKVYTTSQGGKVTFHVTTSVATPALATIASNHSSTATIIKKPIPIGRGVPPPVPPNKPSVPLKKDSRSMMSPSRGDSGALHLRSGPPQTLEPGQPISVAVSPQTKGGSQNVKLGITIGKDKIQVSSGQQQQQVSSALSQPQLESLSKELEDFQQLLYSMAATGTTELVTDSSS